MKQVNLVAALLLFSFSAFAQTVTPDPGPYAPMNQKYEYRWIKTSGGIWNLGKFVQVDSAQFSGVTYVPTAPDNDSSLRVASTAWVKKNITAGGSGGIDSVRRKLSTDTIVEFYGGALGFRRFAFTAPLPGSFVPYTGATQDVNLGEFGLQTGNVEFDNTPTNLPTSAGSMYYNDSDGTLDLILKGGNVKLQIGQESVVRVVNKTATNINLLEANYQAVRVTGAQGQRLKVDLAQATTDPFSAETIGLVTETINNNQEGFVTTSGLVRNINTTGSLQSETWADGDIVYLSPTVAGRITNIKPSAPNHLVIIGYVIHAHATQGSIFVKVDNGYELDELHNVKITTPTNNQALIFNDTTDVWENKNLVTVSSYGKNATADSTILLLSNGTRYAAKDSVGGGGASGWSLTGNASAVTDFLGTTNNRTMRFRTNNVERMTIDSIGRVGMTTTLSVGTSGNVIPSANQIARFVSNTTGSDVELNGNGYSRLFFNDYSQGANLKYYEMLNFGSDFKISRLNDANNTRTERLTIFGATGNLFVGSSPTDAGFRLNVNGTAKISGNLTTGTGSGFAHTGQAIYSTSSTSNAYLEASSASGSYSSLIMTKAGDVSTMWQLGSSDANNFYIYRNGINKEIFKIFESTKNIGIDEVSVLSTFSDIASAKLFVNSTTKGFLMPRMTTVQRDAIASPAAGLQVYNTDQKRVNFYDGAAWQYSPTAFTGTAAPTTTPLVVGDTFTDTVNKKMYVSTGTASSADWTILN